MTGPRHHYRTAGVAGHPVRMEVGGSGGAGSSTSTAADADAGTRAVLHVSESKTTLEAKRNMVAKGPQALYRFPPTSTMEYGWRWFKERDGLYQGAALARRS